MASTEGLMPITRAFLASYYDKYPFTPLSDDVSRLCLEIRSMATDLLKDSPANEGESLLIQEAERQPPHKIDENMWKNREQIEEILFLLEDSNWPTALQQHLKDEESELVSILGQLKEKLQIMTYMPQDFRGTLIRQQRERSERNKQAEIEALVNSGGSIRDRYALLWNQQMERRRQLAQLGSATGVFKTLVKYLVGVPQVLLDFLRQINDDQGPMEEQRQRYGPPLYSLTQLALNIRLFVSLLWRRFDANKIQGSQISLLETAVDIYASEFERYIKFIGEVFANSPFFVTADDAGALEARKNEEYKEINIPAGKTYEVSLCVDSINSYIAWDFSLVQGKMNLVSFLYPFTDVLLIVHLFSAPFLCLTVNVQ
ncbi:hypothetical protein M9H77_22197 [Catharanthus roseus]|uniref:Uncharacterized protein n=1 Tax=Catharanthus roseus TaxID=4058 RepID=A0ACC0APU1_CATRO|nr:hypothetical protein M9H77_22197 [Catharanthus roseus]